MNQNILFIIPSFFYIEDYQRLLYYNDLPLGVLQLSSFLKERANIETSIIENEAYASKFLGINIEIAHERVRMLLRRSKHGRTGRFIELELKSDENFESVLKRYATKYPSLRKRLEN